MIRYLTAVIALLAIGLGPVQAQTLINEYEGTAKARVIEIIKTSERLVPGTQIKTSSQTIKAEILSGPEQGKVVEVDNDFLPLKVGSTFYVDYLVRDGMGIYLAGEPDRGWAIGLLVGLFVVVVVIFSGFQGWRSLAALAASLGAIIFILLPALLAGYPPVLTSTAVALVILTAAIFLTHGLNREATVALLGTVSAVAITSWLAKLAVDLAYLSGFSSDEAVYLNIGTAGTLNFRGLLLGAIIIGILGVLDDIAITQATVVRELQESSPRLSRRELYRRALRIGREHVGALVNTLALAYVGASLPLLLLFKTSTLPAWLLLNKEIFVVEIARTVVGSIGLILAVPLTTALAVWLPPRFGSILGRPGKHDHHH